MPRKRNKENAGLPARWRIAHNAYYYMVPPGDEDKWDGKKQFRLGKTLSEAYRAWAKRLEFHANIKTISQLLERYAHDVVPSKAPKTQKSNLTAIKKLREVFGAMRVTEFKPIHGYQYLDKRGKTGRTAANREFEVLSHAFTKAIEWGLREDHPIKGKVVKLSTPPRTRYIEDWELIEALKVANKIIHAYMAIKLLTGLRRSDLLRLRSQDLKEDGIHVTPGKTEHTTGKKLIIAWSPALIEAKDAAFAARPRDIAPWLFCTRHGKPYIQEDGSANAWESMWQRFMRKALKDTKLEERFTEHDLRAKCASDAETLEHAQALLAHADSSTTKRIYRRKPEVVQPLK